MENLLITMGFMFGGLFTLMMSFYLGLCFIQCLADAIENKIWRGLWD